jgi:thiamine pyrophosphate-dependent acetolactate synthase large subunit-like protein
MSGLGILVGPGVHQAGCVPDLQRFAAEQRCGVVNTWGAKGVFRWDSPFHFGTAGVQAQDFELGLLHEVDVLVTSGLDDREVTSRPWDGNADVLDIEPDQLYDARFMELPRGTLDKPPLMTEIAAVVGPLLARTEGRIPAARRVLDAGLRMPVGGAVVAEPGAVGLWVARTFPSYVAGSVIVPASGGVEAAWDRAAALAAEGRTTILIAGASPPADRIPGVDLEVWVEPDVDLDQQPLLDIAGPVVAW